MIGGRLLDRFGTVLARKVMIISTIILVAASLVGSSISPYYALTLTLNGVAGFCSGFINVFCNSLMGFLWGDRVGTFMQLLHFCFGVGSVAAPLIATAAYSAMNGVMNRIMWDTLSVSYYIVAFLWIIPIILYAIVPEMDAQKSQTEDQNEIVNIKTVPKVEEVRSPLQRIREKLTRTFIMHTLGCLLISAALFFYSEGIFAGLMFTYLTSRELTDDTGAGLINSLFWLTFTIGRLLAIPISAKVKPSIMVILDLIGSSIALITMIVFSNNLTIFTIATGLLGISFASQFPATMSLPASHMGVELTGALTSIIMLGSSFGGMIMPLAITYSFSIAGTLGFLYGIIIMIAISTSCYITLLVFFRKQKIYIPVKPVEPLVDIIVKVEKPQITV
jgi:FHS family Na+ dependent glucose MFS transporter 1